MYILSLKNAHPIFSLARAGKFVQLKAALAKDRNLAALTAENHSSLLLVAAEAGHKDIVELLVTEYGLKVNEQNDDRITPLLEAICNNHVEIVKLLISKGADVDEKLANGMTSLIIATAKGYFPLVQYLVETAGADLTITDDEDCDVCEVAAAKGHWEILEWLLQRQEKTPEQYIKLFFLAIYNGHLPIVQKLRARGVDIKKIKDEMGHTPLLAAVSLGRLEVMRWLLSPEGGATLRERDADGNSAFLLASYYGCTQIMQELLTHEEVDINLRNAKQETALMLAVSNNSASAVAVLLQRPELSIHALLSTYDDMKAGLSPEINTLFEEHIEWLDNVMDENKQNLSSLLPDFCWCPITSRVMKYPVIVTDGFFYENDAIQDWFQRNDTSPKTREILRLKIFMPANDLRHYIWDELEKTRKEQCQLQQGQFNVADKVASSEKLTTLGIRAAFFQDNVECELCQMTKQELGAIHFGARKSRYIICAAKLYYQGICQPKPQKIAKLKPAQLQELSTILGNKATISVNNETQEKITAMTGHRKISIIATTNKLVQNYVGLDPVTNLYL